jgi:histidinol-phosphate aminotransferase
MQNSFLERAVVGVQGLAPYVPGKPASEFERELGLTDIIKLASNENPLGPGARAREAAARAFADLARYPDSNGHVLKAALSRRLCIAPECITLGNGSNDVLDLIVRTFAGPGDEVVHSEYAFAVYALSTQAVGATARVAPASDYGHDLAAMRALIEPHTRLVFIANPNNPTGTLVDTTALEAFIADLPPQVICVLDEAYTEYLRDPPYPDTLRWLGRHPNLVLVRTFSKIHGLAALRVGYAASSPLIAGLLNRVRQPFNVNTPALQIAAAAVDDDAHVAASSACNARGLAELEAGATALGLDFIPSRANFLTIDLGREAAPVNQALLERGVIVRPLLNYGLPRHLRVTAGLRPENERFLATLAQVLGRPGALAAGPTTAAAG